MAIFNSFLYVYQRVLLLHDFSGHVFPRSHGQVALAIYRAMILWVSFLTRQDFDRPFTSNKFRQITDNYPFDVLLMDMFPTATGWGPRKIAFSCLKNVAEFYRLW